MDAHLRTQLAGYKVPRSVWLVEKIGRTPAGKADYRWAHRYAQEQLATAGQGSQHAVEGQPAADGQHGLD